MTLHYSSGRPHTDLLAAGFNLADVSSVAGLNELPAGMKGLVWVGTNVGATDAFKLFVRQFAGNPKLFGFRLGDEPDITGRYHTRTDPAWLMAESDFVHATCPGAKTFVSLMDMGPYGSPSYANTYNYANTHIDLFGLGQYPVRPSRYDTLLIDKTVQAALASGIELSRIVPVFQAFGGGSWSSNTGDGYQLPTVAQMNEMFQHWAKLVPNPEFDFAWVWEVKNGHTSIGSTTTEALALRAAFKAHNTAAPAPVPAPTPTPAPAPVLMLNGQPATQSGIDALVASAAKSAALLTQIKTLLA